MGLKKNCKGFYSPKTILANVRTIYFEKIGHFLRCLQQETSCYKGPQVRYFSLSERC